METYGLGDPEGIRALADAVSKDADAVGDLTDEVASSVKKMKFEGPYATTVRGRLGDQKRAARDVADGIQDLVGFLRRIAGEVEDKIAAERRRREEIERQRREAAERAKAEAASS